MSASELDAALRAVRSNTWLDSVCITAAASSDAAASQRRHGCDDSSKWVEQLSLLRRKIQESERIAKDDPGTRKPRPKEEVVNSPMVQWKPIDRTAALVVAPANWIHKPDAFGRETTPTIEEQPKPRKKRKMKNGATDTEAESERGLSRSGAASFPAGHNPEEYFNMHDLAVKIIAEINKEPQKLTPLARAAIDARAVLAENLSGLGGGMEDFNARAKVAMESLRQSRFAFVTEAAQMLAPLREVRQFFIGRDYEQEIARLKEFVELCERLEALKQRGTLDALTDTILRLAQ